MDDAEGLPARWRLRELPGGVRVNVPGPRLWPVAAFLALWLCGWAAGEVSAIRQLAREAARASPGGALGGAFLLIWLAGWTAGGAFCLGIFSWLVAGYESLEIAHGWIRVKVHVGGIGKSWEWDQARVRAVRLASENTTIVNRGAAFATGLIEIVRDDGRHLFGFGLSRAEGEALLSELRARCLLPSSRP